MHILIHICVFLLREGETETQREAGEREGGGESQTNTTVLFWGFKSLYNFFSERIYL